MPRKRKYTDWRRSQNQGPDDLELISGSSVYYALYDNRRENERLGETMEKEAGIVPSTLR